MATLLGLLAILGLILATAFFVAGEFAYVTVRRSRLEERAAEGDARAVRALQVVGRLSFVLSGAQLGITVTSLVLGFIATPTLGSLVHPLLVLLRVPERARAGTAATVALVVATIAAMILGELAPKNLAIARSESFARWLASPTLLFNRGFGWLIRVFDSAANGLLRLLRIDPVEQLETGVSSEELELIIVESSSGGQISADQADLLTRALEFRQLRAADVMVPRPQISALAGDATGADVRALAADSGHSRFPVVDAERDDVIGVVQAKDLLRYAPEERDTLPVRSLLTAVLAVPESAPLPSVVSEMRRGRSPMAVVIDEYGATIGVVTLEDIVEELVGSIQDEYDPAEPGAMPIPGGGWRVPGTWRIDEAQRDTGLVLPEGDYDTVAGLLMSSLERMPREGDRVRVPGVLLEVERMDGLAVDSVLIQELPEPEEEA